MVSCYKIASDRLTWGQRCNHIWCVEWRAINCTVCYCTANPIVCVSHALPAHALIRLGAAAVVGGLIFLCVEHPCYGNSCCK